MPEGNDVTQACFHFAVNLAKDHSPMQCLARGIKRASRGIQLAIAGTKAAPIDEPKSHMQMLVPQLP
jgi:hypothetical protein